jgi:hypothetical protein
MGSKIIGMRDYWLVWYNIWYDVRFITKEICFELFLLIFIGFGYTIILFFYFNIIIKLANL